MQKITPFLWFEDQAEAAAKFYTSIFGNSKIGNIARYDEAGAKVSGRPAGSVMTVEFQLEGQKFVALNGGPQFKFTEAVSFVVSCKTQAELDRYWKRLSAGGQEVQCGWLKDKFGLSWQIVPAVLGELLSGQDAAKSLRVMQAMFKMVKLDIQQLEEAGAGSETMETVKPEPRTVDEYLAGVNADQRAALGKLRQAIRAAAPGAEECISYGLAAFRLNGRPLVAMGAWSNHCAFYPMSAATVEAFQDQLKGFQTGRGTIRFPADNPLPAALVRKLVKARIAENGG